MNYANQLKTVEYAQAKLEMKRFKIAEMYGSLIATLF